MCEQLQQIRQAMAIYSAAFDANLFSVADARLILRDATALEHMAVTVKAMSAARICRGDERPGAQRLAAEQLAELTGTTVGAAHDTLAIGQHLEDQSEVAAVARSGALSASQLAAVTDGVAANPDAQSRLLEKAASGSLAELRDESLRVKAAAQPDPDRRRAEIRAGRKFRSWTDAGGIGHIGASGNVEDIAQIAAAVRSLADEIFHAARLAGMREPSQAYEFDALVEMAVRTTSADPAPSPTWTGDPASDGEDAPCCDYVGAPNGDGAPDGKAADGDPAADGHGVPDEVGATDGLGAAVGTSFRSVGFGPTAGPVPMADDDAGSLQDTLFTNPDAERGPRPATSPAGGSGNDLGTVRGAVRGAGGGAGGPPVSSPSGAALGAKRKRRPRRGAQVKLLVRVDLDAFLRGYPLDGEVCELDGCGPVPMAAVHDLLEKGDPLVAAVLTRGKTVFGVAHLRRQATAHQKTALEWLYPSCNVKGCNSRAHLEIDHRVDWSRGHYTALDILDCLCRFHHAKKTREGWAFVGGAGKRAFVAPDDPRHPHHHPTAP